MRYEKPYQRIRTKLAYSLATPHIQSCALLSRVGTRQAMPENISIAPMTLSPY